MYNKSIRIDLPVVTISIDDVPEEAQKGFKVLAYFAALLVDYMVKHYKDFAHSNKFSSRDAIKSIYENNIRVLKEKLCIGEIVIDEPEGIFIDRESLRSLQKNCPFVVLETAVHLCENHFRSKRAYNSSHSIFQRPIIPGPNECAYFRVQHISDLFQNKRIKFPFILDGRLYCKDVDLLFFEDKIQRNKNINYNDSFFVFRNGNLYIEVHPIKFIAKPFYYSLHDVVVMGVDLGTINDATCAVYNNQTGEVMYRQIQIPEKEVILSYQDEFVKASDNDRKMIIKKRIDALKSAYWENLSKEICGYAMESKAEYVFFEGLFEDKYRDGAMNLWNPRAVLEKVYERLHNVGIAYQSISPVYTSQYYANGGVVNRIANDRSKAFTPDGKLIDADKNAALNIAARGMIDMYFDTLPEECLVSIIRNNPSLLRCNDIVFNDLIIIRKLVNDIIDTSNIFQRQRYFNKTKQAFCKKYGLR